MTKMRKLNVKGFSLVELMVVVAIIGILSAVAIPNFNRFQRKARASEGKATLGGIYQAEKALFAEYEGYSTDLVAAGYSTDGQLRYNGGFNAAGIWPASYPPAASGARPDISNLAAMCPAVNADCGPHPSLGGVFPGLAGGTVSNAGPFTFVAQVSGDIGGGVLDQWSIDNAKVITLLQDGTQD